MITSQSSKKLDLLPNTILETLKNIFSSIQRQPNFHPKSVINTVFGDEIGVHQLVEAQAVESAVLDVEALVVKTDNC